MRYFAVVAALAALLVITVIVGLMPRDEMRLLARPPCSPPPVSEPAPDAATATRIALRQSQFTDGQVVAVQRGRAGHLVHIPGDAYCAMETARNAAWGVTIRGHRPWDKKRLWQEIEVVDVRTGAILMRQGQEVRSDAPAP
jgi:hypothetical protein